MIALLFVSFLLANDPCHNVATEDTGFKDIETKINHKIDEASSLATMAREADTILSKLIAAKSPVLLSWLKKRQLISAKEDVIAREWRKYYMHQFVLSSYPTKNESINRSVENLFSEINDLAFDQKFKTRLEKIFQQVKKDAKALVMTWKIDLKARQKIIHKIDTMKLYWFVKLKGSRYQSKPLEFVRWGIAYDPPQNEINIGVQTRRYPTDANLYAVLAHELGHSFDSCRWSAYFDLPSPFTALNQCLRSQKSVSAHSRDDGQMKVALAKKQLSKEMAQSLQQNPTCNRSFYPPEGTQKDQLPEAFADWFSAEVYATSSFVRQWPRPDLCLSNPLMKGSSYPNNEDRLLRLYLSHPILAQKHSMTPQAKYCSLKKD